MVKTCCIWLESCIGLSSIHFSNRWSSLQSWACRSLCRLSTGMPLVLHNDIMKKISKNVSSRFLEDYFIEWYLHAHPSVHPSIHFLFFLMRYFRVFKMQEWKLHTIWPLLRFSPRTSCCAKHSTKCSTFLHILKQYMICICTYCLKGQLLWLTIIAHT